MAIPWLHKQLHSIKYFNTEPGYTVLVEIIAHINITSIFHFYDFLNRVVYSYIDFYPQPLNHMIKYELWSVILVNAILPALTLSAEMHALIDHSYTVSFPCMNSIKYHSALVNTQLVS